MMRGTWEELLQFGLIQLLGLMPSLLINVVGIVLAVRFWRKYPTPAQLTIIAMGVLLFSSLLPRVAHLSLLFSSSRRGDGFWAGDWTWIFGLVSISSVFFHTVAIGLLLAAVFWRREQPEARLPERSQSESN